MAAKSDGNGVDPMEVDEDSGDAKGYKVLLKEPIPNKWKCPFCDLLMRDAIQTYRGEMACEICFQLAKGNSKTCPIDKEPIGDDEFFQDRYARREILQLECYCHNKDNGCNWEGTVMDYKAHSNNCGFQPIQCTSCRQIVGRSHMESHLRDACDYREMKCPHCAEELRAHDMEQHKAACLMKPVSCPYDCGEEIKLSSVYDHVQKCLVVTKGATCPFKIIGCKDDLGDTPLSDHLNEKANEHAAMSVCVVKYLEKSNVQLEHDLEAKRALRLELQKKFEKKQQKQREMQQEMEVWKIKYEELMEEIRRIKILSESSVKEIENGLREMDIRANGTNAEEIDGKLNEIMRKYAEIETDIRKRFETGSEEISSVPNNVKVNELDKRGTELTTNLTDLELRLQILENTCYDGSQLWKVDNVSHRIKQAINGQVTALHSAPCFQKRGGYRFCSRLYLNGDGMGRGTHVSLFFVLMKSEYDALLPWPFKLKVCFRLIHPNNPEENKSESFVPDPSSSSFKRPTKDMNIAAGCPMFIKREKLAYFVVEDALYIETRIIPDH